LTTKHRDAENALKGGFGIDGDKDSDFSRKHMDKAAIKGLYGAQALDAGARNLIDCDYNEDTKTGSSLIRGANPEGTPPIMSRGSPTSPSQTGMRSDKPKRRSGAF
jgi:hypothetical protein